MAKSSSKKPTPQELYWARKNREEQERTALLPPGFLNPGNTCFLNSVLQALVATRPLRDAVASGDALSPLLSGSSKAADSMPIGQVFLQVMHDAWDAQAQKKRGVSHSPRPLLNALARKHAQYFDFAQQDAHELLTLLLDATRMEEQDVIKAQLKDKQPESSSSSMSSKKKPRNSKSKGKQKAEDQEDVPRPLVDTLFGGDLASVLVCQRCQRISRTPEPFHILSLSIRPEDYHHERGRTRERIRTVAKKWLNLSGKQADGVAKSDVQKATEEKTETGLNGKRKDSEKDIEIVVTPTPSDDEKDDVDRDQATDGDDSFVHVPRQQNGTSSSSTSGSKGRKGDASDNNDTDAEDDSWSKIRRISLSAAFTARTKSQRQKATRRNSASPSAPASAPASAPLSSADVSTLASSFTQLSTSRTRGPPEIRLSPAVSDPAVGDLRRRKTKSRGRKIKSRSRSKSPQATEDEADQQKADHKEYLRRLLADVDGAHPSWFRPAGKLVSIEDCLRMFTSVEVLSKENMVGCRRCWKVAHGEYDPKTADEDESDSDSDGDGDGNESDDEGEDEEEEESEPPQVPPKDDGAGLRRPTLPHSLSTPSVAMYNHDNRSADADSILSLPEASHSLAASDSAIDPPTLVADEDPHPPRRRLPAIATSFRGEASASSPVLTARPNGVFPATKGEGGLVASSLSANTGSGESLLPQPSSASATTYESSLSQSAEGADGATLTTLTSIHVHPPSSGKSVKRKQSKKPVILRPAYKRYLIGTPPKVLIIHLKRFQQQQSKPMMFMMSGLKKVEDYVEYPEVLDLGPYVVPTREECVNASGKRKKGEVKEQGKCVYRLYAVVVHIGNMLGGHYTAYVALPPSDPAAPEGERLWAYISDTTVRIASKEDVLKQKAYICMYERM